MEDGPSVENCDRRQDEYVEGFSGEKYVNG